MIALVKGAWSIATASRASIAFYAVAAIAAGLYAWGASAAGDRDALKIWTSATCQLAGAGELGEQAKLGKLDQDKAAKLCRHKIVELATYKSRAESAASAALATAIVDRLEKSASDLILASDQAAARQAAADHMETANNEIENDSVGPGWFAALNSLAGLRTETE